MTIADISIIKQGEARLALLARASLLAWLRRWSTTSPATKSCASSCPRSPTWRRWTLWIEGRKLRPVAVAAVTAALERRAVAATSGREWLEGGIPAALAAGEPSSSPIVRRRPWPRTASITSLCCTPAGQPRR